MTKALKFACEFISREWLAPTRQQCFGYMAEVTLLENPKLMNLFICKLCANLVSLSLRLPIALPPTTTFPSHWMIAIAAFAGFTLRPKHLVLIFSESLLGARV